MGTGFWRLVQVIKAGTSAYEKSRGLPCSAEAKKQVLFVKDLGWFVRRNAISRSLSDLTV